MTPPGVLVTEANGVGRIQINRPHRKNALDSASALAIVDALARFNTTPSCLAVMISGSGGDLCSGADLGEALGTASPQDVPSARMLRAIRDSRIPVVAVVEGWAAGLGMAVLAASTFSVAGAAARFALPEATLGFFPFLVAAHLVARVAPQTVLEWALTGARLGVSEVAAAGLVTHSVPAGTSVSAADELVSRVCERGPGVVGDGMLWLSRLRQGDPAGTHLDWCERQMSPPSQAMQHAVTPSRTAPTRVVRNDPRRSR